MEEFLTRERLLNGVYQTEDVETPMGTFRVRPLNLGEKAKVESLAVRGMKAKGKPKAPRKPGMVPESEAASHPMGDMDLEMDFEQIIGNEWEVQIYTLAYGLSIDKKNRFDPSDIKNMALPADVMKSLVAKIREMSGLISAEELVRRFRGNTGRTAVEDSSNNGGD